MGVDATQVDFELGISVDEQIPVEGPLEISEAFEEAVIGMKYATNLKGHLLGLRAPVDGVTRS